MPWLCGLITIFLTAARPLLTDGENRRAGRQCPRGRVLRSLLSPPLPLLDRVPFRVFRAGKPNRQARSLILSRALSKTAPTPACVTPNSNAIESASNNPSPSNRDLLDSPPSFYPQPPPPSDSQPHTPHLVSRVISARRQLASPPDVGPDPRKPRAVFFSLAPFHRQTPTVAQQCRPPLHPQLVRDRTRWTR